MDGGKDVGCVPSLMWVGVSLHSYCGVGVSHAPPSSSVCRNSRDAATRSSVSLRRKFRRWKKRRNNTRHLRREDQRARLVSLGTPHPHWAHLTLTRGTSPSHEAPHPLKCPRCLLQATIVLCSSWLTCCDQLG